MSSVAGLVVPLIVAALSGSAVTAVVTWLRERQKDAALTEAASVSALTEALGALRQELSETHKEVSRLREENKQLASEIRRLEKRLGLL